MGKQIQFNQTGGFDVLEIVGVDIPAPQVDEVCCLPCMGA